ncbi:MAG: sigma-70 family RNA polymerase sigma factor [Clostridia bacterium]|nr:sigma-70 family RNA polymerase sigma factor [Clostridia bacterium]
MSEMMETDKITENLTLIKEAQAGNRKAMDQLIEQNMGLVKNVARRFIGRGVEYEDLVQIGTIGMLKAARSFDLNFGTVFSTYAVPLIIGEIRRFLRDDGMIKVSRDLRKKGTVIMKTKEDFTKEHGREPHLSELAAVCHMSAEDIAYALEAICPVYSLQDTIGNDEDGATLESITPASENVIEEATDKLALAEAIAKLDSRSQQIVKLRFYRDLSQQQTADILGITQVKVSREEKKIFEFLRKEFLSGNH